MSLENSRAVCDKTKTGLHGFRVAHTLCLSNMYRGGISSVAGTFRLLRQEPHTLDLREAGDSEGTTTARGGLEEPDHSLARKYQPPTELKVAFLDFLASLTIFCAPLCACHSCQGTQTHNHIKGPPSQSKPQVHGTVLTRC